MKLIRKTKKGFTLVELIVVIAIVAILAAVSVVSYIAFINQANLSADQQMVTQMNKIVQADAVLNGENGQYEYAGNAVQALYKNGFNSGKMQTYSSEYSYAYSLENNKFYLIDNKDEVIYPEAATKSTLWGFYRDAVEGKVEGITKYIAMANVVNKSNLESLIGSGAYTIDLNGYFFGVDGTYSSLTVVNGMLVKGNVSGDDESILVCEEQSITATVAGATYENKVFNNVDGTVNGAKANTIYKNSVFYNSSMRTQIAYSEDTTITFENCTFIDGDSKDCGAIEIYDNTSKNITVIVKNCTFIGTNRAININGVNNASGTNNVQIDGCTFNGVIKQKYAALQITSKDYNIEFKNNVINSLGKAVAVVRFHGSYNGYDELSNLDKITFSNNQISSNIHQSEYVDLDDKFTPDDFYQAALAKFVAGLK